MPNIAGAAVVARAAHVHEQRMLRVSDQTPGSNKKKKKNHFTVVFAYNEGM